MKTPNALAWVLTAVCVSIFLGMIAILFIRGTVDKRLENVGNLGNLPKNSGDNSFPTRLYRIVNDDGVFLIVETYKSVSIVKVK